MLAILFDHKKSGVPFVTLVFLTSCLIVSLPTQFIPELYHVFGGYKPLNYSWQKFTLAFEHGVYGYPLAVHLILNGFLLWFCGVFTEKILGSARFLLLISAAILAYALAHSLPYIDGHGSSGVIWAFPPIIFLTLREYHRQRPEDFDRDPVVGQARGILILMWGIVTLFMTLLPYLAGWRGNPITALILANTFHASGTVAGFLVGWLWRKQIRAAVDSGFTQFRTSRIAYCGSLLIPLTLSVILILALSDALDIPPFEGK